MTSSFTTATMWSSSCTAAWAGDRTDTASSSARTQCGRRHSGRLNNFIALPVSGNTMFQNVEWIGADAPHSVQLQLEEQRIGGLVFLGCQSLQHRAQRPASAIVFKPGQALDQLGVLEGIVVAEHAVPALGERPLCGQVDLFRGLVDEAVTQVYHAAGTGPIGRAEVLADGGAVLGVELPCRVDAPAARDLSADGGQQVGGIAGARRDAGQGDLLRAEKIALAEGGLQPFQSAVRLDEPAGDGNRQLVGVVDAVAADELVL